MEKLDRLPALDLRFENTFRRSLQRYADSSSVHVTAALPKPIGVITPSIVTYAVIKDIVVRPLVEGFSWALLLLLARPALAVVRAHGHSVGLWAAGLVPGLRG